MSFSPDGAHVAVACDDRVLRIFSIDDAFSKNFAFKFKALSREPVDVAFGATNDLFVLTKVTILPFQKHLKSGREPMIVGARNCRLHVQGGIDSAVLEKYDYTPGAKGDAIQFSWEVKGLHGKDPPKGLWGAVTPHGHSVVLSFSTEASLQVYNAGGTQLAAVSSGGAFEVLRQWRRCCMSGLWN